MASVVSLVSFTIILWGLSGPLTLGGIEIPRAMVFIAYIYVIIATVIAFVVGYLVIAFLMQYLKRGSFLPFVLYRLALGILLIILLSFGVLQAY